MHEINIAVLGATGVGKSFFIQRSFDVYNAPLLAVTSRKMSIDGSIYTVRLIEMPFEDLEVEEDNTISWPDTLDDVHMPQIDGVLTLYDVMDKDSLSEVPEFLSEYSYLLRRVHLFLPKLPLRASRFAVRSDRLALTTVY